jgi:hypothetical protein
VLVYDHLWKQRQAALHLALSATHTSQATATVMWRPVLSCRRRRGAPFYRFERPYQDLVVCPPQRILHLGTLSLVLGLERR